MDEITAGRMDELRFSHILPSEYSISVISGQWEGDNKKLCKMKPYIVAKISALDGNRT